MINLLLTVLA